ncbi:WD40 repeat-like protein [Gymnopus androsaceus JB14]|uniref:WD40 repeat-like protein n=1 Tax=Gymnopus androsaceus JB14 TaxID=1447944 RepID=A0A6A4H503_9AGAR|nr:WD40 repeat-like protein [Gymnopus androsaceus JB14]
MSSTNAQQASDRMAMTKDLSTDVLSVLKLAKEATTGLGMFGIEPALNGVLAVCEMVQNMKSNKKDLPKLKEKIDNFITALPLNNNNNDVPAELYKRLQNLSERLPRTAQLLPASVEFRQFLQANDTKAKIEDIRQAVRDALQEFSFHGGISIEIVIEDIQQTAKTIQEATRDIQQAKTFNRQALKLHFLIERLNVAPARFDAADTPSPCLHGTREQLLKDLHNHALGSIGPEKQIIWIHGTPGRGKSTIAKSLAIRLHEENALAASFFFSRSHESRSNFNNVFRTIAHQIAMFNQQFHNILVDILEKDNQLGHSAANIQFKKLIIEPLSKLPQIQDPWVLVFDALDECGGGAELLKLLCEEIGNLPINLHIIFTSRPEHPIHMWFDNDPLKSSTHIIILDNVKEEVVSSDILWYLKYNLVDDGKKPHKEALADTEQLKLLADPWHSPTASIAQILKLKSGLIDDLYAHILHELIPEGDAILIENYQNIMGSLLHLQEPLSIPLLSKLLGYNNDVDVKAMLELMSAVLIMPEKKDDVVRIAHLSFWEYATSKGARKITIRIWNAETGEQVVEPILGHTEYVTSVGFSSDGKRVVSGSYDKTIRIWNAETGEQRVVSGSYDKTIRIWNAETGEQVVEPILGHTDGVTSVGFSSDGKRVVSGSYDKTIRIWNAETGEQVVEPILGHTMGYIYYPNLECRDWRTSSGTNIGTYTWVTSVGFSSDGKRVVSGSYDKTIRIWNAETGEQVVEPILGHTDGYICWILIRWKESSLRLYDRTIRIWNAETGEQVVEPILGHTNYVTSTIRIWNARLENKQWSQDWVIQIHLYLSDPLSERQRLISGSDDKTVWIQNEESTVNTSFHAFARQPDPFAMTNGWVHGKNSELLFWVPPQHRMVIWRPNNTLVIGETQQS